jgi:signal transduction histidine kinase
MSLQNIPIRRKLMTVCLLTSGAVLLLTCGAFIAYEVVTLHKNMIQGYLTRAQIIAANSTAALAFQSESDAADVLGALKTDRRIVAACIFDSAGKVFAEFPTNAPAGTFPPAGGTSGYRNGGLQIFCPIAKGDRKLGTVYLQTDLSTLTDRYRAYAWLAAVIIATSLLLAYLLSRLLQTQISEPILSLADTAQAISKHRDFSVRARKFGDDELGLLTDAFNQMLTEIQAQDQAIKKLNTGLEQRIAERTAELESANHELEAFSYSVSHDLRAPLRAVNGFAGIVLEDYGPQLPPEGRQLLERIRDRGQQMGELIDDLLAFSRLGRQPVVRQTVDTRPLVQNVLDELKPLREGRPIELRLGNLPPCQGDPALLKQVWVNLLSNAIKYTRGREPAIIDIGSTPDAGRTVYFVRDNGAGFDMQYANKLFGVFQRLHRTTEFEGTGVGLAIVQRVVQRHGGRAWAEGEVNRGATFYFTLEAERKS